MSTKTTAVERRDAYKKEIEKFKAEMKAKEAEMRKNLAAKEKEAKKEIAFNDRKRKLDNTDKLEAYTGKLDPAEMEKLIAFLKKQEERGGFVSKAIGRPLKDEREALKDAGVIINQEEKEKKNEQ
jgi:hypothetical protein